MRLRPKLPLPSQGPISDLHLPCLSWSLTSLVFFSQVAPDKVTGEHKKVSVPSPAVGFGRTLDIQCSINYVVGTISDLNSGKFKVFQRLEVQAPGPGRIKKKCLA